MGGEEGAIQTCLTYKSKLEARLKEASEGERLRLLAEIRAGEKLIERFTQSVMRERAAVSVR